MSDHNITLTYLPKILIGELSRTMEILLFLAWFKNVELDFYRGSKLAKQSWVPKLAIALTYELSCRSKN